MRSTCGSRPRTGEPDERPRRAIYLDAFLIDQYEVSVARYRACLEVSRNPDMLCATTHWLYTTLRRAGRDRRAREVLAPIHADIDLNQNSKLDAV